MTPKTTTSTPAATTPAATTPAASGGTGETQSQAILLDTNAASTYNPYAYPAGGFGVAPLDFDGANDALLQAYDGAGRTFMKYEVLHGAFHDVPAKFLIGEMVRLYPKLCRPGGLRGNMEEEGPKR